MNAAWASVLAGGAGLVLGYIIPALRSGARHEGRVDAVLERLAAIAEDHEGRIRVLERPPARR